jgi:hypothetical protein
VEADLFVPADQPVRVDVDDERLLRAYPAIST